MVGKSYTIGKIFFAMLRGKAYLIGAGWKGWREFYIVHLSAPPLITKVDVIWYLPDTVVLSGMIGGRRFKWSNQSRGQVTLQGKLEVDDGSSKDVGRDACDCIYCNHFHDHGQQFRGVPQGVSRTRAERMPHAHTYSNLGHAHPVADTASDLRDTSGKVQL